MGERKKCEILGGPAEGGSGGGERSQIMDAPTKILNTQHNNNNNNNDTPHNTTGDPAQGGLGQRVVFRREGP